MKKIIQFLIIAILFLPARAYAFSYDNYAFEYSITAEKSTGNLSDNKYSTSNSFNEKDSISISSNKDIRALYILWDTLPDKWSIKHSKATITYNNKDNFYLHQLIYIPEGTQIATIRLNTGNAKIAEIYAFDTSNPPDWVQNWQKPYLKADMLLLPTHADDEHLFFGGTMPLYAGELNYKVQVAYLTNHKNYRLHELLNGLWAVGVKAYPVLPEFNDYYASSLDEAQNLYNSDEILAYQVMLIRRFKPEVVIGQALNGEYGHGAHMLNSTTLIKALETSNNADSFTASSDIYGLWDVPKCYLHLYPENKITMSWNKPLAKFSQKNAFEMAIEGFSKHISQQEYFQVGKKGVFDCRQFGLYRSLVGIDTIKNDFFENIKLDKSAFDKYIQSIKF